VNTPPGPLSTAELRRRCERLPRVPLGHLPTPLEELSRLSERLGGPRIFMKRDDCTGLLFGGNKTRHNEFILGLARERGAEMLVWGAGVQSNNCRQTAASCAKLGLPIHLVLTTAEHAPDVQGNLLLDYIVGATTEFIDTPLGHEFWDKVGQVADRHRARGKRVFCISDPGVRPAAAASYTLALVETCEQLAARDLTADAVYVCSCGATGAGVFLGKKLLGASFAVRSIMPIEWKGDNQEYIATAANQAAEMLGVPACVRREEIDATPDFIGPGYGRPSPAGMEATRLVAQAEGILLDPVYTAKAMAGLIADVRSGRLSRGQNVVFIHTGGTPAMFAYQREFAAEFGPKSE
jgi:1-aminocyclopropane-1-carboxylate deaminase/D-cysteine desulfhydrase-like pyridoxal-dependent ACC family enzyme